MRLLRNLVDDLTRPGRVFAFGLAVGAGHRMGAAVSARWPADCACLGCREVRVQADPEVAEAVARLRREAGPWFGTSTGGPAGCDDDCTCPVCQLAGGGMEELHDVA